MLMRRAKDARPMLTRYLYFPAELRVALTALIRGGLSETRCPDMVLRSGYIISIIREV